MFKYIERQRRIARRKNRETIFDLILLVLKIFGELTIAIILFILGMNFLMHLAYYINY